MTNVVARATASADELSDEELVVGGKRLRKTVLKYSPRYLAILGIGAYRTAFDRPKATLGLQPDPIETTKVWVLPSPSGLNAHYQVNDLARLLTELREAAQTDSQPAASPR
jgi:TDG/mug DNA glycosylase family protein